jgi:hypothetical protein
MKNSILAAECRIFHFIAVTVRCMHRESQKHLFDRGYLRLALKVNTRNAKFSNVAIYWKALCKSTRNSLLLQMNYFSYQNNIISNNLISQIVILR